MLLSFQIHFYRTCYLDNKDLFTLNKQILECDHCMTLKLRDYQRTLYIGTSIFNKESMYGDSVVAEHSF